MSSPPWSPCYPLCNKLWQVKATALNKNCEPRSRKTENITASTLTCIRGEKKSLTRVYELVWNTIKSAPQPMKCHGDKGRLSPSQRRRVAYIHTCIGARASLHRAEQSRAEQSGAERCGATRRSPFCVRAARPRFPMEKPHFPRDWFPVRSRRVCDRHYI